jgi:methionine-rich copper-binding protein CopC
VSWQIVEVDTGNVVSENGRSTTLPVDSMEEVDRIAWPIDASVRPGTYRVTMKVVGSDGQALSTNHTDITVR